MNHFTKFDAICFKRNCNQTVKMRLFVFIIIYFVALIMLSRTHFDYSATLRELSTAKTERKKKKKGNPS